jgi:hypothetical protein
MGISPSYWGREAWHFIHYVTLNYPEQPTEQDKKNYLDFLNVLPFVLPCPICGIHFVENMKNIPPRMDSMKEFFEWSVDMHNEVNKVNNTKVLSYQEALDEVVRNGNKKFIEEKKSIDESTKMLIRKSLKLNSGTYAELEKIRIGRSKH